MTAEELEAWLKEEQSQSSGWGKGDGSDETVGHERSVSGSDRNILSAEIKSSGRKIIEILKKNPSKDTKKYDEDDIPHMRKVVSYNKRHLAQEGKAKQDTDSKSYKSLKNWGHDAQKI